MLKTRRNLLLRSAWPRMVALAVALGTAAIAVPVGVAHAELIATPVRGDSRLVQFNYDADNTYLVLSKPKVVTHIQFAPDEMIQSVAAGDSAQWETTPTRNRKNLFVKPKYDDLETSLTVLTDKRSYQFVLRSTGDGKKWYQRVSWIYSRDLVFEVDQLDALSEEGSVEEVAGAPTAPAATTEPTQVVTGMPAPGPVVLSATRDSAPRSGHLMRPEDMRFRYAVEGDAPFKPEIVFDDGKFTYFRLPPKVQELPALFGVIDGTDFSLVNYTVDGNFLVAQRLLTEAVLKLGRAEVRIKLKEEPAKRSFFNFGSGD